MKYLKNDINTYMLYLLMFAAVFITIMAVGFSTVYASSTASVVKVSDLEKELWIKQKALEDAQNDVEILKQRLREELK